MSRWNGGTTTQRGYGSEHQKLRKELLARWKPGDPCARCGEPMWGPSSRIHLGHTDDRAGYIGLEHAYCNAADGAIRSNRTRAFRPSPPPRLTRICRACGQPYMLSARLCEICAGHYHPNYSQQRTCSRKCGVELIRRNRRATGWVPPAERPKPPKTPRERKTWPSSPLHHYTCRYCGKPFVTRRTGQLREVCDNRECQLARLTANNWRVRRRLTPAEADALARMQLTPGALSPRDALPPGPAGWQPSRQW